MTDKDRRINELEQALRPLANIADEYDADGLDECRPDWIKRGVRVFNGSVELYSGRGGKSLLTLNDALHARDILWEKVYPRPGLDDVTKACIRMYEASMPIIPWMSLNTERRERIMANYRQLGCLP